MSGSFPWSLPVLLPLPSSVMVSPLVLVLRLSHVEEIGAALSWRKSSHDP